MSARRVRRGAFRSFSPGAIFVEMDGPWRLVEVAPCADAGKQVGSVRLGPYDLVLERLSPEEEVVWQVLRA